MLLAWGSGSSGQLCTGGLEDVCEPQRIHGLQEAGQPMFACGGAHVAAVLQGEDAVGGLSASMCAQRNCVATALILLLRSAQGGAWLGAVTVLEQNQAALQQTHWVSTSASSLHRLISWAPNTRSQALHVAGSTHCLSQVRNTPAGL